MKRLMDMAGRLWVRRAGLGGYVLLLVTATHWPQLRIEGPVPRSDLWLHLGAFGVLGTLLALGAFFGRVGSWRNLAFSWMVATIFAGVDELTQGIPGLGRTVAVDDFVANVVGVTLGVAGVGIASAVVRAGLRGTCGAGGGGVIRAASDASEGA